MTLSVTQVAELNMIRQKTLAKTVTREELKRGMELLRQGRVAAQTASSTSRTAKKAPDTAGALAGLMALKAGLNAGGKVG